MSSSDVNTFWKLINKHQIEIPVIQRDYAQGRTNKRVKQIRESFLKSLITSLSNSNGLSLGFIYGKIEGQEAEFILNRNREAVDTMLRAVKDYARGLNLGIDYGLISPEIDSKVPRTKFIPLDGQQRLTTLFLLHWYLIVRSKRDSQNRDIQHLASFKYKTRRTTQEFCTAITAINLILDRLDFSDDNLSSQLKNYTWFLREWLKDPSVNGMLKMLDEIHAYFVNNNINDTDKLLSNLLEKEVIHFDFLDLDELEQTDDLYVKMNARGKALTDFEHFKAWLQTKQNDSVDIEWELKIDTDWYDLFWLKKNNGTYNVENSIYHFFKSITLLNYLAGFVDNNIARTYIENIVNKPESYIPHKIYEETDFFIKPNLDFLFKSLDSLSQINISHKVNLDTYEFWLADIYIKPFKGEHDLTTLFLSNNKKGIGYYERVYYYAFILFVNEANELEDIELKERLFKTWMRVTRNLIFNTYIQNPDNFIDAVRSIKLLSSYKFDFLSYMLSGKIDVPFFSKLQVEEEVTKLEYFAIDGFEEIIKTYENHPALYGQIGFIFKFLKNNNGADINEFKNYCKKIISFLDAENNDIKWKLHRRLLMEGNYFTHISGHKFRFHNKQKGSLRALNDNWRKVFNSKEDSVTFLALENVITNNEIEIDSISINDWRKYLIDLPEIFSYCQETFVDIYHQFDIRLLRQKTYNGKHADLYTYVLYLKLIKSGFTKNFNFKYEDVNNYRTENNIPSLKVSLNDSLVCNVLYYPLQGFGCISISVDIESTGFLDNFNINKESGKIEIRTIEEYDSFLNSFIKGLENIS
jgi:hypothetical protein